MSKREEAEIDCQDCEGSGECPFCQGYPQDDCPYDCNNGECAACDGSGIDPHPDLGITGNLS